MAVLDVRNKEGEPIDKIIFATSRSYSDPTVVQKYSDSVVIQTESGDELADISFEDLPNLILALQKAVELWIPKVAPATAKRAK